MKGYAMNDEDLRKLLAKREKAELIELCIKLNNAFDRCSKRLFRIENELIDKTDLTELIDSLED
jgi:hypothetical protein